LLGGLRFNNPQFGRLIDDSGVVNIRMISQHDPRTVFCLNQPIVHREKLMMAKKKTTRRKTIAIKPAKQSGTTSKAQSIRDVAKQRGKKARPKDIIAALAEKDIKVTSPQVSTTLKAAGLRRGRRKRKVVAAVAAKQHSGNGDALNINELLQVKQLADNLGCTAKVKELVAALERLQ
jgi:predicted MarR family transcription regulator